MKINIKLKSTALIVLGVIGIVGVAIGVTGYWPIALVDRTPITYNAFKENFLTAEQYYGNNLRMAGEDDLIIRSGEVQRDLQRATMEGLIEAILIDRELAKKYSASDLQQLIDNKIGAMDLTSDEMKKATKLLYGLNMDEFTRLVVIPAAKQEILAGNLTLQNTTFADWLAIKRGEIHVSMFVPALYWNKEGVQIK